MKVKLIKSENPDRWYTQLKDAVLDKEFSVQFSESASKSLARNVYEVIKGEFKGKLIDVKDTQVLLNL